MGASTIYLIRHAETALNAARVVQLPDTPLSDRGLWQARRLGKRLQQDGLTHVVSSDYPRARVTAEHVRDATRATLTLDPRLRERNLGELRGRPYSEVRDQVFADDFEPDSGESWTAFHTRVDAVWASLRTRMAALDGSLAIVTHGLVCRALVRRHLTLGDDHDGPIGFPNASVTIAGAEPPWRVRELASDTHLADTGH